MPRRVPDDAFGRKYCGSCDQYKDKGEFTKCRTNPDGLCYECKPCVRHREQTRRDLKRTYDQQRRSTDEHRANHRAQMKRWRDENPDRSRATQQRYTSSPQGQQTSSAYQPRRNENGRRYQKANPVKFQIKAMLRRTFKLGNGGSFAAAEWEALKAQYGYTCLRCGRSEPSIKLTADHVVPVAQGGSSDIGNIQPLCGSCNSSKGNQAIDYRY